MSKLLIKPAWLGILALLVALGVAIRIALALAAFNPGDQPVGYVAQDEVTNFNLRSDTETLYRGHYDRERWSGGLFRRVHGTANRAGRPPFCARARGCFR